MLTFPPELVNLYLNRDEQPIDPFYTDPPRDGLVYRVCWQETAASAVEDTKRATWHEAQTALKAAKRYIARSSGRAWIEWWNEQESRWQA